MQNPAGARHSHAALSEVPGAPALAVKHPLRGLSTAAWPPLSQLSTAKPWPLPPHSELR